MKEYPRILFMGTPEIAKEILLSLIENEYNVIGVLTQCDKEVGRKRILTPPPAKIVALEHNIPVYQVEKLRLEADVILNLDFDLIVTCAYGQIVPTSILNKPKLGSINVHGSLLPKYRGASPIQTSLINGDKVTGVTIMEMIDKMDAGKMFAKEEVIISEEDNYTSLTKKITLAGKSCLIKMLPSYIEGKIKGEEQNEEEVSFCHKIKKEDEKLSLDYSCDEFVNYVRGLSETPGGYLLYNEQILKIFKAKKINSKASEEIGKIVSADKQGLILQLKDGQVSLLELQKQGKSKMDYKSFINGDKNILNSYLK